MQTIVAHERPPLPKTEPVRDLQRDSWSSGGIDVKAGTDCAFVGRVVARDWIEHREHRLARGVALHGRNHEPLFEGWQRSETEDRLYLGRSGLAFGKRSLHLFR